MRSIFHALASLWLTIPILVVIAVLLVFATFFDGLDVTIGAVRKDWYRSWWFVGLLGLLAVNLIACTVKRKPYQLWMWGFLKTHSGILLIIIGCMVSSLFKIYGDMPLSKGDTMNYVQLEDQRELTLTWTDSGASESFPVDFNWYRDAEPDRVHPIAGSDARVRIRKFYSNVERQPMSMPRRVEMVIDQGGRETPAFTIPINEETRFPGSPLILTFVESSEERYQDLKTAGPDGILELRVDDQHVRIDVAKARKSAQPLPGGGSFQVLEVYDRLVLDEDANIVEMQEIPGMRVGKGVKFQIKDHSALSGTYYVLEEAKSGGEPYAVYASGERKGKASSFEIFLKPPLKGSVFAILKTPAGWRYFINSSKGSVAGEFKMGDRIRHPFMPFKLEIGVLQFLDENEVVIHPEEHQENRALYPALDLVFETGEERVEGSLLFSDDPDREFPREFELGGRTLRATFSAEKYRVLDMELTLLDARQENHPGTLDAAVFESDVRIYDGKTGQTHEVTIGVNYPFTLRGYTFYQSGFDGSNPDNPRSIFQVLYDPGTNLIYTGALISVSGILFMFYLKPMVLRARGRSQRFGGKSLRKHERILFAFFSLLVPFAMIFLHVTRDRDPLRTYQRGRILAVSWIVVLSGLMCYLGFFVL